MNLNFSEPRLAAQKLQTLPKYPLVLDLLRNGKPYRRTNLYAIDNPTKDLERDYMAAERKLKEIEPFPAVLTRFAVSVDRDFILLEFLSPEHGRIVFPLFYKLLLLSDDGVAFSLELTDKKE